MKNLLFILFFGILSSQLFAQTLYVDFGAQQSAVENGYQQYQATHEQPYTFTSQTFEEFGASLSITPSWSADAVAASMQMIVRNGVDYVYPEEDLLIDWIGTDTRQVGDPLTLTISGLPVGTYSWLSYHHDINDQTGQFDVKVYDAAGEQTVSNIDITNGTNVPFDSITKLPLTITSNGVDDIRLEFTVISSSAGVSNAFFVMNGFELESNNSCYNYPPEIDGPEARLVVAGRPVRFDVAVTDDGKPFLEGCDSQAVEPGTSYPLEFSWQQLSGSADVIFAPTSADVKSVTVTFPLQGWYELALDVSDAPEGVGDGKTARYIVEVEVVAAMDGDVNYNRSVFFDDLVYLASQWLYGCGDELYCADFDGSGQVDLLDFAQISENWLIGTEPVVINEFVASNKESLADGDGNYSDWIELYNQSDKTTDLAGWYLTDDADELDKWSFPANTTLAPGEYLVVFASDSPVDNYIDPQGYLHTNFALSKDGEYLALVSPEGVVNHEYKPLYPPQETDISYGMMYGLERYFATVSPGSENVDYFLGYTDKPDFSVERGFYDEPFTLEIESDIEGAFIHYTLDGSEPSEQNGILYDPSEPLEITTTTVVRAGSVMPGYRPGKIKTATYIFVDDVAQQPANPEGWPDNWGYEPDGKGFEIPVIVADYEMDPRVVNNTLPSYSVREALLDIPTISIAMLPEDFLTDGEINGIYANPMSRWERKCSIEYIYPDGRKGFQEDCKIEIHGNASRYPQRMQKHSMRITFTSEYGVSKLKYPLFENSDVDVFNQLVLRACFTDSWGLVSWAAGVYRPNDSQYTRDVWMKESIRDMGNPSSYGRYVHVYVDGLYFGVHDMTERLAEDFFAEHLGGEPEDWEVYADFGSQGPRWRELMALDPGTLAGYQQMEEYVDMANFADYMLLHFYAEASDWPYHNGYAAANVVSGDGKFRFFSWDQESVLDKHGLAASRIDDTAGIGMLFNKLRASREFRQLFADRFYKHCFNGGALTIAGSQNRYLDVASRIDKAIVAESARWGDTQMSTPYGNTITQPNPIDDFNHDSYPMAPNGPDFYFTREQSWLVELDNVINNFIPAIHDVSNSYALINVLRNKNLYPAMDPPELFVNGNLMFGGNVSSSDTLSMVNPNGFGTVYYTLDGTDPRMVVDTMPDESIVLIAEDSVKKVLVPTGDIGTSWTGGSEPYNDSGWQFGSGGVGYETLSGYQQYIGIDVFSAMYDINSDCYVRIPFSVSSEDLERITSLSLKMRFDDGFVAYLNGVEIGRANFTGTPSWNSTTSSSSTEANESWNSYNISEYIHLLNTGENVLAVHGINRAANNSDFLISTELEAGLGSSTPDEELISPSAIEYSGGFYLDKSSILKARVKNGSSWSALAETIYAVGPIVESLRVSELMYHPADPNTEFIELVNVGGEPINLNKVKFTKGIDFVFGDYVLQPGGYTVIVEDISAFEARYGTSLAVAGQYSGALNNAGDRIRLKDAVGSVIQDFEYSDNWHELTDGYGFSLTAINPASSDSNAWGTKDFWRASLSEGGTPSMESEATLAADSIVFNELLAHSHSSGTDWIELHNTTAQSINISGWFLSDDNSDDVAIRKYEIPQGIVIPAGGYYVFEQGSSFGSLSQPLDKRFGLSEGGESVYLYSGAGGAVTGYYQTEEDFDASETAITFGRFEKPELSGGYDFTRMAQPTPGAANSDPLISDIVITEIHYNPVGGTDYEYIELYNRSDTSVSLMSEVSTEIVEGDVITESLPWRLEGTGFTFPDNTTIAPGEYIIVAKVPDMYSSLPCDVYGPYDGKLDNGGEQIELQMAGDQEFGKSRYWIAIEKVDYLDDLPWPVDADGNGHSLQRASYQDYARDYSNWYSASPTPGE